jgi:hypothetical protein
MAEEFATKGTEAKEKPVEAGEKRSEGAAEVAREANAPGRTTDTKTAATERASQSRELERGGVLPALEISGEAAEQSQPGKVASDGGRGEKSLDFSPQQQAAHEAGGLHGGGGGGQLGGRRSAGGDSRSDSSAGKIPQATAEAHIGDAQTLNDKAAFEGDIRQQGGHLLPSDAGESVGRLPDGTVVTANADGTYSSERSDWTRKTTYGADGQPISEYRLDNTEVKKGPDGRITETPPTVTKNADGSRDLGRADGWNVHQAPDQDGQYKESYRTRQRSDGTTETRMPDGTVHIDHPLSHIRESTDARGFKRVQGPTRVESPQGESYWEAPDGKQYPIEPLPIPF